MSGPAPRPLMPPLVWVLLFGVAMLGLAAFVPAASVDVRGRGVLAAALALAGVAVAAAGMVEFRRRATTVDPTAPDRASALVTSGVFRLTRNPMYLGMAAALLGLAVWTGNVVALALLPAFVAALTRFQIRAEEVAMRQLFGPAFDAYAAEVPRWVFRRGRS